MPQSDVMAARRISPAWVGLGATLLAFLADRIHKWAMLDVVHIAFRPPIEVTPFLDLLLVWNRGISYGLFQQDDASGRLVLVAIHFVAALLLVIWIFRTGSRFTAFAVGLVAGGALGNGVDRLLWGAVADFFHFHAFGFSWYVFNVADVAIVAGVLGLLYDSLRSGHNDARNES